MRNVRNERYAYGCVDWYVPSLSANDKKARFLWRVPIIVLYFWVIIYYVILQLVSGTPVRKVIK